MQFFKKEKKKYFVKDESLRGVDGDMFNYSDIAQVLDDILSTNTPPYNVAVIGKWGLGKSSLINLVTERYRNDDKHYQIQEINAWKYEKESLRKVFLKQLWQGISNQRIQSFETVKKEISSIISAELPKTQADEGHSRTKKFWLTLLGIVSFTAVAFIIYKIVQAYSLGISICTSTFWIQVFLRYCKNVSTVLIGPVLVALCKLLVDDYHAKQSRKIELNFPIETTDDYEIFLESKIKEQIKKNPELKIITVIDDLDRLSIDKIVEALDALKAFVGFERCVFIVPFDDEIIKHALDKRRIHEFNDQTEITDVVESELILDKLFQFKLYLPPILDFDIQQYAYNLVKQEVPDFLSEYCDEAIMKKVCERILIYPGVRTPRQVKKLLNAFINNMMVVSAREASGRIQNGLLTSEEGIMQIAKISVLQADFNRFYDLLFKDMRCIELMLSVHRGEESFANLPVFLQNYFYNDEGVTRIKNEYETLINYLHKTEKYHVDSIAPYLYLAQDEISVKTGDELQRRTINALKSRNIQTLKSLLDESESLAEVIIYHLSRAAGDIGDMLWASMMVFENISFTYKPNLAQCIIDRVIELDSSECEFLYSIPSESVFSIANIGEKEVFNHQFRIRYLTTLSNEKWFNERYLHDALIGAFKYHSTLCDSAKSILKVICNNCLISNSVKAVNLFDVVDPEKPEFFEYWGKRWFEKLCGYIESENDFSQEASKQLCYAFSVLRSDITLDDLFGIMMQLTQYAAFLPTLNLLVEQEESETSERIKESIGKETATKIFENVITHDFVKNEDLVCRILDGLRYEITEENADTVDAFMKNAVSTMALDDALEYCGKNGYFKFLPKTIEGISSIVFENDNAEQLLEKIAPYFTDSQVGELGRKLFDACTYRQNKKYDRELSIIRIVSAIDRFDEELQRIADSKILVQFSSYYQNENYREFTSAAMGYMKNSLSQQSLDKYINSITSRYNNYRQFSLTAINRVTMKMSSDAYRGAFDKIVTQSEAVDFELALEVIQNHDKARPTDSDGLRKYILFLVNNLSVTEDPDKVLNIIRNSFSAISVLREMSVNAYKNSNCSMVELAKTIAHFVDRKENIEGVSDMLIMLNETEISNDILIETLSQMRKYQKKDVYEQLANELQNINAPQVLKNLATVACHDVNLQQARDFVLKCLRASFEKVDYVECSIEIMDLIKHEEVRFKESKEDMAGVLRFGFISTTSDILKQAILQTVSSFKIKTQFKKTLPAEELEYYKKWIA